MNNYNQNQCIIYTNITSIIECEQKIQKKYKIEKTIKKCKNKVSFTAYELGTDRKVFIKGKLKSSVSDTEKKIYELLFIDKHPNIENIIEIIETKLMYYIVSEYIDGVNLNNLSYIPKRVEMKKIIEKSIEGLNFIHNLNILHCDIKLENIMYSHKKIIIVDFDLSKMINPLKNSICCKYVSGTEYFIAPESFDLKIYSKKSDIWSLGVCFYKLITGKFPYIYEYNQEQNMFVKNCFQELNIKLLDEYLTLYSYNIIQIIKNMLKFNDDDRSTTNQVLIKLKEKNSVNILNRT